MKNNNGTKWLGLVAVLLIIGCYEPEEGCLDVKATNFLVSADVACADCCTFPQLKLAFRHRAGLTNPDTLVLFSYDSVYVLPGFPNAPIQFQRIKFYLSNLEFINDAGSYGVDETILLEEKDTGTQLEVTDNFALIDRSIFASRTLGSFPYPGEYHSLRFTVGLEPEVQNTTPGSLGSDHPLGIQPDSLNWEFDQGYVPTKVVFFRDTISGMDSTVVRVFEPVTITLPSAEPILIESGFDILVTLQVDYLAWFAGLDLSTASETAVSAAILNNLTNSFSVISVTME